MNDLTQAHNFNFFKHQKPNKLHFAAVTSLQISNKYIVSSSLDNQVFMHNPQFQFNHSGPVYTTALQNDTLMTGSLDGYVKLFNLSTQKQLMSIQSNQLSAVLCSDLNNGLGAFGCENGFVSCFDIVKNTFYKMQQHESDCIGVNIINQTVYSAGFDGLILKNDLRDCQMGSRLQTTANSHRKILMEHKNPITVFKVQQQMMLVASKELLQVWDLRQTKKVLKEEEPRGEITDADIATNGNILFSTLESTVELGESSNFFEGARFCRYYQPGCGANKVIVGEKEIIVYKGDAKKEYKGTGTCIGIQKDGRRMVIGTHAGEVILFE